MRNNLRNARVARGISAVEIADALYMTDRNYYYIEAGKIKGNPDTWERLEKILDTPQEVLRENVEG